MKRGILAGCLVIAASAGASEFGSPERLFGYWTAACVPAGPGVTSCSAKYRGVTVRLSSNGQLAVSGPMARGASSIEIDDRRYEQTQSLGMWHFDNPKEIALALAGAKRAAVSYTDSRGNPEFYKIELTGYKAALDYMIAESTKAAKAARQASTQ